MHIENTVLLLTLVVFITGVIIWDHCVKTRYSKSNFVEEITAENVAKRVVNVLLASDFALYTLYGENIVVFHRERDTVWVLRGDSSFFTGFELFRISFIAFRLASYNTENVGTLLETVLKDATSLEGVHSLNDAVSAAHVPMQYRADILRQIA